MTRKKFMKMLMGAGMQRNDAADCAALAQDAGRPYFRVLGDLLNFHRRDFGNPLAWRKMRRTIIHGYNSAVCRFWRNMDEGLVPAIPQTEKTAYPYAAIVLPDLPRCPYFTPGGGGQ